jgi:nicotinate-nucleotide pyrophosphorylase (carboxylating)
MNRIEDAAHDAVRRALAEDLGDDGLRIDADVTSRLALPDLARGRARMLAKQRGVVAGLDCARAAFALLDPDCRVEALVDDGARVEPGQLVMQVDGRMRALLVAERTALNFVQRLSGVATLTRSFVDAVAGTGAAILDTRKTTPGMRLLEKRAVLAGGGRNHRIGLFDQVLLKENHFGFAAPTPYQEVVARCVRGQDLPVVAEARTVDEGLAAVRGGAAVVLLDNFAPGESLRLAVNALRSEAGRLGRRVEVEASGGIVLGNVRAFAECGVDRLSIGALTHSAVAIDFSLLVEGVEA